MPVAAVNVSAIIAVVRSLPASSTVALAAAPAAPVDSCGLTTGESGDSVGTKVQPEPTGQNSSHQCRLIVFFAIALWPAAELFITQKL